MILMNCLMKFPLINQKKGKLMQRALKKIFIPVILSTLISVPVFTQELPEKPVPPRLVNDFAGMLTVQEVNALEQKLVLFNDSTSTQIAIVTVSDLGGYNKSDYAQRLAEKWGIGQRGRNNGVLILVKPKTNSSRGEVVIATGYGAEGVIPDLVCGQIIDNEILPAFQSGDYYGGLDKATSTLMSLARGEFTADQYGKSKKKAAGGAPSVIFFIILIIFLISVISRKSGGSNHRNISSSGLPFWMLLGMLNSGSSSHSGSWGGFSGGSGSGGFGGFGGGSFGGGGAGGSW
jgi:uncharacterized protein